MKDLQTKIKKISKYFACVLIGVIIGVLCVTAECKKYNTAYAYPSNNVDTVVYNQLHGMFVFQSGSSNVTRYFDTTTRSGSYSGILDSGFKTGLLYINLPVTYITPGTQTLRTEFEPANAQGENYEVYLRYKITYPVAEGTGDIFSFRTVEGTLYSSYAVSNGWFREWLGELEDFYNITITTMPYRIEKLSLTVDCSQDVQVTSNFNIQYRNSTSISYNDFIQSQQSFEKEYREFSTATVNNIGEQITELQNSLFDIEILPNFTIANLMLIVLTIPLVWAILRFFLGG